jgi:hypothetical protein
MGLAQKMVVSPGEEAKAASSVTVLCVCLAELTHKTQNQQCSLLLLEKYKTFCSLDCVQLLHWNCEQQK